MNASPTVTREGMRVRTSSRTTHEAQSEMWLRRDPADYIAIGLVDGPRETLGGAQDGVTLNVLLPPSRVQVTWITGRR